MIDIGEDLVAAYLERVVGCSVVQCNVRTGRAQAEIDVVGGLYDLEGLLVAGGGRYGGRGRRLWVVPFFG